MIKKSYQGHSTQHQGWILKTNQQIGSQFIPTSFSVFAVIKKFTKTILEPAAGWHEQTGVAMLGTKQVREWIKEYNFSYGRNNIF